MMFARVEKASDGTKKVVIMRSNPDRTYNTLATMEAGDSDETLLLAQRMAFASNLLEMESK